MKLYDRIFISILGIMMLVQHTRIIFPEKEAEIVFAFSQVMWLVYLMAFLFVAYPFYAIALKAIELFKQYQKSKGIK